MDDGERERERRARLVAKRVLAKLTMLLSDDSGRELWRAVLQAIDLEMLIEPAREGDPLTIEILRERCRVLRDQGGEVAADIVWLMWDFFIDGEPPTKPGPKSYVLLARNMIIAGTVRLLVKDHGLVGTRGVATRDKAVRLAGIEPPRIAPACQVVAEELPPGHILDEREIEKIWEKSAAKRHLEREQAEAEAVRKDPPSIS